MTEKEINEGNKILTQFDTGNSLLHFDYHKSWDLIIPAYRKLYTEVIHTEWYRDFKTEHSDHNFDCLLYALETTNILAVFRHLVALINWYGETKRVDLSALAGTYDKKGVEDVLLEIIKAKKNKPLTLSEVTGYTGKKGNKPDGLVGYPKKEHHDSSGEDGAMGEHGIPAEAGMFDWNKLSLEQMAIYLKEKYRYSSSGDAKCIYHLVEFYEQNKPK